MKNGFFTSSTLAFLMAGTAGPAFAATSIDSGVDFGSLQSSSSVEDLNQMDQMELQPKQWRLSPKIGVSSISYRENSNRHAGLIDQNGIRVGLPDEKAVQTSLMASASFDYSVEDTQLEWGVDLSSTLVELSRNRKDSARYLAYGYRIGYYFPIEPSAWTLKLTGAIIARNMLVPAPAGHASGLYGHKTTLAGIGIIPEISHEFSRGQVVTVNFRYTPYVGAEDFTFKNRELGLGTSYRFGGPSQNLASRASLFAEWTSHHYDIAKSGLKSSSTMITAGLGYEL